MKLPLRLFLVLALLFGLTAVASPTSTLAAGAIQQAMPDISDNGTMVFTQTDESGSHFAVKLLNNTTILFDQAKYPYSQARISPDGKKITYDNGEGIVCIYNIVANTKTCTSKGKYDWYSYPYWAGNNMVLMDYDHLQTENHYMKVVKWDISASTIRYLLPSAKESCGPVPSPDGRYVALTTDCHNGWRVEIYEVSSGKLLSSREGAARAWSSDSSKIVYQHDIRTKAHLVIEDLLTGKITILDSGYIAEDMIDWKSSGVVWAEYWDDSFHAKFNFSATASATNVKSMTAARCDRIVSLDIDSARGNIIATCVNDVKEKSILSLTAIPIP